MQPLYAIRFTVAGTGATDKVIGAVARWLMRRTGKHQPVIRLDETGSAVLDLPGGAGARELQWERIDVDENDAVRVDQFEPMNDHRLLTRITLSWDQPDQVSFRLVIGIVGSSRLVPAELLQLRPPTIVGELLGDRNLTCTISGQRVDCNFVPIKHPAEADLLADLADSEDRLPLMILNTAEDHRWGELEDPTKQLARNVSGLARVTCLAWVQGVRRFRDIRPDLTPAVGEALLVWPSKRLDPEPFDIRRELTGTPLMRRLLSAAVTVFGGRDEGWNRAERAQRQVEQARLQEEFMRADNVDSIRAAASAQIGAKDEELARQKAEYDELLDAATHTEDELREQLNLKVREVRRLDAKLQALEFAPAGRIETVSFEDCYQHLQAAQFTSMADVLPLLELVEKAAGGALVVTDNARENCRDSSYPMPARIAEQVVRLAEAAVEYRRAAGSCGIGLHEWLLERGLVNSTLDDTLQTERLHEFMYEGRTWDRTPHIKVDDHTHPDRVGRIYFAADPGQQARFIVDHIGQKLYLKEGSKTRKARL